MICQECGGHFDDTEMDAVCDRVPYGDTMVDYEAGGCCPYCGSEHLCEEGYCAECATETAQDELQDGLCRLCVEEARQALDWMWGMLTPPQKQYAVNNTEWMEE